MADRVRALRSGRSARSLRPPPLAGPSAPAKGKAPIRANPQFEAYHNPWRLPESDEPEGLWEWCFGPTAAPAGKVPSKTFSSYDGDCSAYSGRYGECWEYDDDDDDVEESKGAARWLKPVALVLTVALLMAFVALVPPPSYDSREEERPNSTLTVQPAGGSDPRIELPEELPELYDEDAQRVFRVVHRPR